ncbi:MAG: pyroglutamyl-peptidase I [Thermoprotei archaeon]|nr:MAG: pyroglutamyl-peptidase I [Thermoprotei archaeon]
MSILITGFGPYEKYKMNPAQLIARELDGKEILGVKIVGKEVPVSFKRVIKIIPEYIKEIRPRVFLGLGLACGRPNITLERVAINIMDATKPDNDGYKPEDEPILPNGPAAYFATLPLKRILKVLRKNGIPAMISNSAGTFVCNTLMYVALHTVNELKLDCPTGFIHVPCMPEQVVDKPQPSMSFGIMVKAIRMVVEEALKYEVSK